MQCQRGGKDTLWGHHQLTGGVGGGVSDCVGGGVGVGGGWCSSLGNKGGIIKST